MSETVNVVIAGTPTPIVLYDANTLESANQAAQAAASAADAAISAAAAEGYADDAEVALGLVQAAALAGDTIYPDTTAGLAATAEGGYFWTSTPPTLWREVGGVAVRQSVLLTDGEVTRLFANTADITTATAITGNRIATLGFTVRADGGAAYYDRWAAPMAVLPAGGEGIWWFEAADASRWRIVQAAEHMAACFGALGGAGIDAAPILNEAFTAPTVRQINLGALTHYITHTGVRPASGKNLVGINRKVSWLRVIPVVVESFGVNAAVLRMNDDGGVCRDYSIEGMRSHFGIGLHGQPHGHLIYASAGGTCRRTRVIRVDVHNIYGYAHYTTTGSEGDGLLVEDTQRIDCRAFNFNVGFEEVGNIKNHINVNPYANAAPQDGGSLLSTECLFHQYGAIKSVLNVNAIGKGTAGAGISIFTTENGDIEKVKYLNPDIDGTLDFGVFIEARNAAGTTNPIDGVIRSIRDIQLVGGKIRSTSAGGVSRGANLKIYDTEIIGLNGSGLEAGTGDVEFHGPIIEGNRNPAGGTAAFGVAFNGIGTRRWYGGGKIRAIGPVGSSAVDLASIEFFGSPQFFPTKGDVDTVITDKLFRIPFASWAVDTPGSNYQVNISLAGINGGSGIVDIAKTIVQPSLEIPFPAGAVGANFSASMEVLWIGTEAVRVYIITTQTLTGCVLKARVTEFA